MALPTGTSIVSDLDSLKEQFGLIPVMIGDVIVDVVTSYSDPIEAEITEFPVEAGADITDHRRIRPQYVTMEVILSDPDFSGTNIAKSAISGTLSSQLKNGWRDKRDRLLEIAASNDLITVQTPEKQYNSFTILSVRPTRTAQTANAYFCTVEMREVRVVSSELSEIDPSSIPKDVQDKQTDAQKSASKRSQKNQGKGKNPARKAKQQESTILNNLIFG